MEKNKIRNKFYANLCRTIKEREWMRLEWIRAHFRYVYFESFEMPLMLVFFFAVDVGVSITRRRATKPVTLGLEIARQLNEWIRWLLPIAKANRRHQLCSTRRPRRHLLSCQLWMVFRFGAADSQMRALPCPFAVFDNCSLQSVFLHNWFATLWPTCTCCFSRDIFSPFSRGVCVCAFLLVIWRAAGPAVAHTYEQSSLAIVFFSMLLCLLCTGNGIDCVVIWTVPTSSQLHWLLAAASRQFYGHSAAQLSTCFSFY